MDYKYRKEIYEKNEIPVAFLHYHERRRTWKSFLAKRVEKIRKIEARRGPQLLSHVETVGKFRETKKEYTTLKRKMRALEKKTPSSSGEENRNRENYDLQEQYAG